MRLIACILMFWSSSCNTEHISNMNRDELWSMIRSSNQNKIIIATTEIQNRKDTTLLDAILFNSDDARISHLLKFYGKSVYQIKMEAAMELTGIDPPKMITGNPDSSIILFYSQIAENFRK